MMIYFDEFKTWSESFGEAVRDLVGNEAIERLSTSIFEYIDDAGDFVCSHTNVATISERIYIWLINQEFCVFHGTRLLPEEIGSMQQRGLIPLVATDREHRLTQILERHPNWDFVRNRLSETLEDVGPREMAGRREGQVHFSLSRSGLVNGFDHYLTHGSEFDQHVVQRLFDDESGLRLLNSATSAFLVHVRIGGAELVRGAHPIFTYFDLVERGEVPGLARTFLDAWAYKMANPQYDISRLRTDCCMMLRDPTPLEDILMLERLDQAS